MTKPIEVGDKFGLLTVVAFSHSQNGRWWSCSCQCGNSCTRKSSDLNKSLTCGFDASCGCHRKDKKEVGAGLYRCGSCQRHLPASDFYSDTDRKHGITSSCKQCYADYRIAAGESRLQQRRAYYHRTKHLFSEARRQYRLKTRDAINARSAKWRALNPERRREVSNAWTKRNRSYGAYRAALRRAAIHRATPPWADLKAIKKIYEEAARLGMVVDHIVPLNSPFVCGLHCEANLQIIPAIDNLKKSNRYWPDMPCL